jgi:hypothetical protein
MKLNYYISDDGHDVVISVFEADENGIDYRHLCGMQMPVKKFDTLIEEYLRLNKWQ